jgi:hypothetical protein
VQRRRVGAVTPIGNIAEARPTSLCHRLLARRRTSEDGIVFEGTPPDLRANQQVTATYLGVGG